MHTYMDVYIYIYIYIVRTFIESFLAGNSFLYIHSTMHSAVSDALVTNFIDKFISEL